MNIRLAAPNLVDPPLAVTLNQIPDGVPQLLPQYGNTIP